MIEKIEQLSDLVITRVKRVLTVHHGRTHWECSDRPLWAIVFRHSGSAIFTCGEDSFVSDAEHALILPRGTDYSFLVTEPGDYSLVEFEADACGRTLFSLPVGNAEHIRRELRRLEYSALIGSPYRSIEQIHGVYGIFLSLLSEARLRYVKRDKAHLIEQVMEYVSTHYQNDLSNESLARRCGMSEVYFRKLFVQVAGVSPITYLHKVRLGRAAELLLEGQKTLAEIATEVGYSNHYHFSKMFKKYMGMPPATYARLSREL